MLNKLQIIFIVILLSSCGLQPKVVEHKPSIENGTTHFDANLNMWVSGEYKIANTDIEEISIYVKRLVIRASRAYPAGPDNEIEKRIADYFLIINSSKSLNGLKMLDDSHNNFKVLESGRENIDGVGFYTETILFNALKFKKGAYFDLIDKTIYSPPNCGILKSFYSSARDLSISFIDSVICAKLMSEVQYERIREESLRLLVKEDYIKRLEKFKKYSNESFGFIAAKQLTRVSN